MVHGGLLGLWIFLHVVVPLQLNAKLKDCNKFWTNVSKSLQQAYPILENIPLDNLNVQWP
jgi:hypothetical protein